MNRHFKLLSLATLMMTGAVTALSAQTPLNSAKEIAAIRMQWESSWNTKSPEGLVKLYAQDAVLLTSAGERISGRDAIGKYFKKLLDSSILGPLSISSLSEEDSGNLAFVSGSFTDKVEKAGSRGSAGTGGGDRRQPEGYYLIVLKRQANGLWLIQQQCSTDVLPPSK
jgi:ketosteroid isomerase-like protein